MDVVDAVMGEWLCSVVEEGQENGSERKQCTSQAAGACDCEGIIQTPKVPLHD